jgi:hypothetical protein
LGINLLHGPVSELQQSALAFEAPHSLQILRNFKRVRIAIAVIAHSEIANVPETSEEVNPTFGDILTAFAEGTKNALYNLPVGNGTSHNTVPSSRSNFAVSAGWKPTCSFTMHQP